jgi:hypothetical protein
MGDMSILDDAIREHLELKRAHGADESELKRLEDEAFGPAERPGGGGDVLDPFAEAPTEFLAAPAEPGSAGRRVPDIADLQEPPPPAEAEGAAEVGAPAGETDFADAEASAPAAETGTDESEAPEASPQPAEEQSAGEHQIIAEPAPEDQSSPHGDQLRPEADLGEAGAEERHAIAEQPTEMFDVEQQLFEDTAQSASPSDEQLIDAERAEPRITPAPADDEPADEFDEFFSEQRLSDELNQALDTPLDDEPSLLPSTEEALAGIPPLPSEVDEPRPATGDEPATGAEEPPSLFLDPDTELGPPSERAAGTDSGELPEPPLDRTVEQRLPDGAQGEDDVADEHQPHEPGHVDALEDTPEFLEDAPEDDDAWFEQKPPKDFDFGD